MSINVPELSGKELCDIMDCTHAHAHTYTFFRRYFMQGLKSLNSVYVCLNISIHGLGLAAPGNYML
jgi:hypothetical protein